MKTKETYDWNDMVEDAKFYFEDFTYDDFNENHLDAYLEELKEEIGLELTKTEYDEVYEAICDKLFEKVEEELERKQTEWYEYLCTLPKADAWYLAYN